jgi:hypothetical protein
MKNVTILLCVLITALAAESCRRDDRSTTVVAAQPSLAPTSPTLTLSRSQLMFLDWDGEVASRAKVVRKRIVGDSAVEIDIHFPSNRPGNRSIDYVSSGVGGRGSLVGLDVREHKSFALRFTLVSIDGASGSDMTRELAVGAVIGPTAEGKYSGHTPVTLASAAGRITAISTTSVGAGDIYEIGVHAHMVKPEDWSPSGSMVTIRVEPVQNATIPAWP